MLGRDPESEEAGGGGVTALLVRESGAKMGEGQVREDQARVQAEDQEVDRGEGPTSMPEMGNSLVEAEAAEEDEGVGEGIRHPRVEIIGSASVHDSEIDVTLAESACELRRGRRETHR
jgi:hypothetical protein